MKISTINCAIVRFCNLLSEFIRYDKSLRSGPIRSSSPEKSISSISVIAKLNKKKCIIVYGINISRDLMMVRIQLSQVLASIRSIFFIFTSNLLKINDYFRCESTQKQKKKKIREPEH